MADPTTLVWGGGREGRGPFHAHDGWYFDRDDEGQVLIQHRVPMDGGSGARSWEVDAQILMDAATWASVVVSLSATPDSSEAYSAAQALHD